MGGELVGVDGLKHCSSEKKRNRWMDYGRGWTVGQMVQKNG